MTEYIELITQYPVFFSIIGIVLLGLLAIIVFQGRTIKTPWFELGPREHKKIVPEIQNQAQPTAISHIPSISPEIHQSPTININTEPLKLSAQQVDDIAIRISERIQEIKSEIKTKPSDLLYQPPEIPERIIYILSVKYTIDVKIMNIVLETGGHWAGSTMAGFDTFLDLAYGQKLITEGLAQEYSDFFYYTQPLLLDGNANNNEVFLQVQYLALHLNRNLDSVLANIPSLQG